MEECVEIANSFGEEYARRFNVPVFLYEAAARREERRNLANVREGQFEGLRELIGKDPSKEPDFGPNRIHPTAGATAVGARPILIAYNVDLATNDLSVAKKIAHKVRERDGGLPKVKALGFELKDRNLVQVSMNLTDFHETSIHTAYEQVASKASEMNVGVEESEVVGLVPLEAVVLAFRHYLKLKDFKSDQIIESKLFEKRASPKVCWDCPLTNSRETSLQKIQFRGEAAFRLWQARSRLRLLHGMSIDSWKEKLRGRAGRDPENSKVRIGTQGCSSQSGEQGCECLLSCSKRTEASKVHRGREEEEERGAEESSEGGYGGADKDT